MARRRPPALRAPRSSRPLIGGVCVALLLCSGFGMTQPTRHVESLLEQRQRNVIIQRWDLSCGAAAIATILNYQHGDAVSEREVAIGLMGREEYLADPDLVRYREGFSLLDLKRFVDRRGYNGVGLGQLSLEDLSDYAPIIVPISLHGYRHFVVFRGIREDRVLMADPAFGNREMSVKKFQRSWLDLPELGRVGFYVERGDGTLPVGSLSIADRRAAEQQVRAKVESNL